MAKYQDLKGFDNFSLVTQTLRFDGKIQLSQFDNFSRENSLVTQTLRFDEKI